MAETTNEKSSLEKREDSFTESTKPVGFDPTAENINARLANPLAGIPREQVARDGEEFAKKFGLGHLTDEFRKGALVAQDPLAFESFEELTEDEKAALRREITVRVLLLLDYKSSRIQIWFLNSINGTSL